MKTRPSGYTSITSRRTFIKTISLAGGAALLHSRGRVSRAWAQLPGGTLDPAAIPKYLSPLFIPPPMPRSGQLSALGGASIDYYQIAVRQFAQQILPRGLPATTVWGYGSVGSPGAVARGSSFSYPSFTIE